MNVAPLPIAALRFAPDLVDSIRALGFDRAGERARFRSGHRTRDVSKIEAYQARCILNREVGGSKVVRNAPSASSSASGELVTRRVGANRSRRISRIQGCDSYIDSKGKSSRRWLQASVLPA
jgi:hypothetical protein